MAKVRRTLPLLLFFAVPCRTIMEIDKLYFDQFVGSPNQSGGQNSDG